MLTVFAVVLTMSSLGDDSAALRDVRSLIDVIESLQQPIEDFRCEFEGSVQYKGNLAERQKGLLGEGGLSETFSGVFLWKRGGDTHSDTLNRRAVDNAIAREVLVVRTKEQQSEEYRRLNDAPLGYSVIKSPKEANSWRLNSLGWIFLLDKIKAQVGEEGFDPSVSDEVVDGRPLKVLTIKFKSIPDSLHFRYWIDLRKSGHVVRVEGFMPGKVRSSHMDIKLDPFKIGDAEVWMPVYGVTYGYVALENNVPVVVKEPTSIVTMYVVGGTMEFNKKLGPEAFRVNYKMGTPISDELKKLNIEYGQQKIGLKPSKADAEKMLKEQVAKADAQKNELIVAIGLGGFDWWPWAVGGLIIAVLASLVALGMQRRRH